MASVDKLQKLIQRVKTTYNAPIVGVISDKAENIVQAVANELPGVPHGYCRFHFLKNVASEMNKIDHEVRSKVQHDVAKISTITTIEKKG